MKLGAFSSGYGTNSAVGAIVLTTMARWFGIEMEPETYQSLLVVLASAAAFFMRAAQAKAADVNATANAILAKAGDVKPAIVETIANQTAIPPAVVVRTAVK